MYFYPTTTEFAPNKTSYRLMKLFHGYFRKTGKGWAHISQGWIIGQMEAFEKQKLPASTLNYNLAILEREGFIIRQKRHIRDKSTGHLTFRPSMYKITKKLRTFFAKLATYFKRCGWTPTLPQLGRGITAVVGTVTTREEAFYEYRSQQRARASG
ncbi:hypothetical protein F6V25_07885 [Oryzomonas japonica]|uniref:Uncharacterized protein n=1 Tax=Oryzomonas japonica TaxID=2603858 RepID=A0A7J4ZR96_9BACT|nr:hypothetical protein [Oryzomonas japonica]KAB0665633.1 hypothetical protein F6V25_07885 [Oryzomonas japonica]